MTDSTGGIVDAQTQKGFLGFIERTGNKLPDPVFLFFYLIIGLVLLSVAAHLLGWSAILGKEILAGMPDAQINRFNIGNDGLIPAKSLLSEENFRKLWVEMPKTFTHFHPLGYVLVVMLGAGVAERSGLFATAIKSALRDAPAALLTPLVALVAMVGNHAADSAYVVLIPLAGIVFASVGRHPLAGIAAAFAGVSGGFSANLFPGQLDALLFGITQEASAILAPNYEVNIAGNWAFIIALLVVYLPIIWFVTDKIVEPRLGVWEPKGEYISEGENAPLTDGQKTGLARAGLVMLAVTIAWIFMAYGSLIPGVEWAPLRLTDGAMADAEWYKQLNPFFTSLVAMFLVLFLAGGWVYGRAAGTINNNQDLVDMMSEAMKDMGYYLVLAFAAAHFVAMFNWSNLGLISAVHGANAIEASGLPLAILLGLIVVFCGLLNLFVGSASAKWALLAPVLVPMLMLLGVSPEGATAVYRVGDSATNIITPLMVYFPLILVFARRWQPSYGLGSLTAMMVPYSILMLISGVILTVIWVWLNIPLGSGATIGFDLAAVNAAGQ